MKKAVDIPIFSPIIETHFHLDMLKEMSFDETMAKCRLHQIEKLITISTAEDNLDLVIQLTKTYPELYCTQGIHPHDAQDFSNKTIAMIKNNLNQHAKIVAIGEIGLDYHYNKSPREQQIYAFKEQLELAILYDLPVVIHTREADQDTMAILIQYAPRMNKKGVLHSFTSSLELAKLALDLGFYIGFNGIITFKNADNVREVLTHVPLDRILLETDAPFLTPIPYRGMENAPFYLPFIAMKMADILNISIEDLLARVYKNSHDLFHF